MPSPAIVSAVSRHLAVADLDRSIAFYRDVLGFDHRQPQGRTGQPVAAELIQGPAQLMLSITDQVVDSTGEPQPRGAAVVFLQTDDVAGFHHLVMSRGGKPSPLAKANWIKMRVFELRDPDGHTIWLGQSYHVEDTPGHIPAGQGQLRQMLPHLPLDDIDAGIAWYQDKLGFHINYRQEGLGIMSRDTVTLLLLPRTEKFRGYGSCSAYVKNADELYAEFRARGANVLGEPVSHPWGLRDFEVVDPEGNRLTFGQTFE
jgi:catechol 2,3-dioxygenase-like lactoylglutathione lyase family enzyme